MDFMVAAANFTGVVANFDKYLVDKTHMIYPEQEYNIIQDVCLAQASFGMYSTHSSILWTIAIAVYMSTGWSWVENWSLGRPPMHSTVSAMGFP